MIPNKSESLTNVPQSQPCMQPGHVLVEQSDALVMRQQIPTRSQVKASPYSNSVLSYP